jgi:hypothetical protein
VYVVEANSVTPILLDVDPVSITEREEKDILTIPKMFSKMCMIKDD